ncbi:hypothetical protein IT575_01535 [bacterium]|nr:hypothetical protein [bacterium]
MQAKPGGAHGREAQLAQRGLLSCFFAAGILPGRVKESSLGPVGEANIEIFTGLLGAPMSWICYEQFNFVENPALNLIYFEPVLQGDHTISGFTNGVVIDFVGDVGGNCRAIENEGVPFVSYEDRTNGAVKIAIMR